MITKISADQRHFQDMGFLKTYWLFSFSNYQDENNMNFGSLRVFNDDVVMPGSGFPEHPHKTMEIVTIVLKGTLSHGDSLDNEETIQAGEIQRMSAGEGISHSEFNNHDEPVHLYQLWFYPNEETKAGYEQAKIDSKLNELNLLASDDGKGLVHIQSDAKIYQIETDSQKEITYRLDPSKGLFMYVTTGSIEIDNVLYSEGDQARISDESQVILKIKENTKALIIEVNL